MDGRGAGCPEEAAWGEGSDHAAICVCSLRVQRIETQHPGRVMPDLWRSSSWWFCLQPHKPMASIMYLQCVGCVHGCSNRKQLT